MIRILVRLVVTKIGTSIDCTNQKNKSVVTEANDDDDIPVEELKEKFMNFFGKQDQQYWNVYNVNKKS